MAQFIGNDLDNTIVGGPSDDQLYGFGGTDVLDGGFGLDTFDGGTGFDYVDYRFYDGMIVASLEDGLVEFPGFPGGETLVSIEAVLAGGGDDLLIGDAGGNLLAGGPGDDTMFGDAGNDTLLGEDGNDSLVGEDGDDALSGGPGDDLLDGGFGIDSFDGGPGFDWADYRFWNGNVVVSLAAGTTSFPGNTGAIETLTGIEGVLTGAGADTIEGDAAANVLSGGPGNDTIFGDSGGDTLLGDDGSDALLGEDGDDALYGGDGDDVLDGGFGIDVLDGGPGFDWGDYRFFSGAINASLDSGTVGFPGSTTLLETIIGLEGLLGGAGGDTLIGDENSNAISGGPGHDAIFGGPGDDWLIGDDGADLLIGEAGADSLRGLAGNDTLSGGGGFDVAEYVGRFDGFTVARLGASWRVTDLDASDGVEGSDTLSGVERLSFADRDFELVNPPLTTTPRFANLDPDFLFDPVFYLLDNPELVPTVTLAGAAQHYLAVGAAQGRDPTGWFDAAWYESRWPDIARLNMTDAQLFMHYNLYGIWEGRAASPMFDDFNGARYLADSPDVAAYVDVNLANFMGSRTNGAIWHYIVYGAAEQRPAYDVSGNAITLDYMVDLGA